MAPDLEQPRLWRKRLDAGDLAEIAATGRATPADGAATSRRQTTAEDGTRRFVPRRGVRWARVPVTGWGAFRPVERILLWICCSAWKLDERSNLILFAGEMVPGANRHRRWVPAGALAEKLGLTEWQARRALYRLRWQGFDIRTHANWGFGFGYNAPMQRLLHLAERAPEK